MGAYGKDPNDYLGRLAPYGKEEILAAGARCLIANRMANGLSTLKIGTYSKGKWGNKTVTLSDFSPAAIEEMENRCLPNARMDPAGRYPYSIDFSKRSVKNQNLIWPLIYGVGRYPGREEAFGFLVARNEGVSRVPTALFLASIWGRMTIDYTHSVMEGTQCITQLGSKIGGLKELKLLSRHSDGRKYHHTFSTESGKGYLGRYVLPKIDLETGRVEYQGALPKVLASFRLQNQHQKNGIDTQAAP